VVNFGQGEKLRVPPGTSPPVRKIFRRLLKILPAELLAPVDALLLLQLSEALWLRDEAMRHLTADEDGGILVEDAVHGGQLRKHPALTVWRMAAADVAGISAKFGLSPKERLALIGSNQEEIQLTVRELLDAAVRDDGN